MEINKIAVVGAGVMGSDVALDMAANGYDVILKDLSLEALSKSKDIIKKNLRAYKMIRSEWKSITLDQIMEKIQFTINYDDFKLIDLVIENIEENWVAKKIVYSELNNVCNSERVLFAANTSCISITKIATQVSDPTKVIGTHFMNPVPLKVMVETIRGFHTSEETVNKTLQFLRSINKNPVVVNDSPGFVANRLSHLFMNEAAFLIQDNIADPAQIDQIFKQGYGHKMGPLETADLIGLDTVVNSLDVLYQSFQDPKFRCCPYLKKMVDAGLLGRKCGKGFYEYK